jgi:DNA replication protein DnaC
MTETTTLPLLLKQLGLPSMLAHWEEQSELAQQQHWDYPNYLSALANMEASNRRQRRIARHIKESKLSLDKTLDSFDFKATPSVNAAQITALAENVSWVTQGRNVVISGPSGVGKTHLACAIAYQLIEQGQRALFMSTTTLVQKLQVAQRDYKLADAIGKLARIPLLILDDIGYVKINASETSVLFELIADRYESNSLIITANQPFGEWDEIFPDGMMAVAAVDRLVHHATLITIEGDSY